MRGQFEGLHLQALLNRLHLVLGVLKIGTKPEAGYFPSSRNPATSGKWSDAMSALRLR